MGGLGSIDNYLSDALLVTSGEQSHNLEKRYSMLTLSEYSVSALDSNIDKYGELFSEIIRFPSNGGKEEKTVVAFAESGNACIEVIQHQKRNILANEKSIKNLFVGVVCSAVFLITPVIIFNSSFASYPLGGINVILAVIALISVGYIAYPFVAVGGIAMSIGLVYNIVQLKRNKKAFSKQQAKLKELTQQIFEQVKQTQQTQTVTELQQPGDARQPSQNPNYIRWDAECSAIDLYGPLLPKLDVAEGQPQQTRAIS